MRTFLRWWETLGRPERIVAMSLATGGIVAITNSLTWAIAVCYMTHQKAQAAIWQATRQPSAAESAAGANTAGTEAHSKSMPGSRDDVSLPLA